MTNKQKYTRKEKNISTLAHVSIISMMLFMILGLAFIFQYIGNYIYFLFPVWGIGIAAPSVNITWVKVYRRKDGTV